MKVNMKLNRILAFVLVLCTLILPLASAFSIVSSAEGVMDLEGTELNGATLITEDSKYLNTSSYEVYLDKGYDKELAYIQDKATLLTKGGVKTPFASFFIDTLGEGGSVYKGAEQKNGYDAYGFVAGTGDKETNQSIVVKLQYNYDTLTGIMGSDGELWDINNDSWKSTVNKMDSVGVIGNGAVIVQKFTPTEEKEYPSSNNEDWTRLNQFSGLETDGLHTVNFFEEYSPEEYKEPFNVYAPDGEDLQKGVYIKITVVYELSRVYKGDGWWIFGGGEKTEYKNIIEETVFYLCNTSNEVVFTNLYFETNDKEESDGEGTSASNQTGVESKGGAISDNQGSSEGFRVDIDGWNYDVSYHFNGSTNALPCEDGQIFLDVGRYDFVIKSGIGVVRRKTVYIHEKTTDKNISVYFGNGLMSADSVRVFAPSETYPVYVADTVTLNARNDDGGLIKHAPLVGKVYYLEYNEWFDSKAVPRDENGLPKNGLINEKTASQQEWSLTELQPGNYEVVFFNNEEYFDGTATGDTYKFVWRFTLMEQGYGPVVNQELLNSQIGFSDFKAEHYVAALPTKGAGDFLCVFKEEYEAYDFACKYFASTVKKERGKFIFDGVTYDTEAEMLVALREKAKSIVEKRYFDATETNTYLTISENIITPVLGEEPTKEELEYYNSFVKALDREYKYDVLVFTDSEKKYELTAGLPYLNDRVNAYLDESGVIKVEKLPVKFISVADYESSSVIIKLQGSDISFVIPYNTAVQAYLEELNAPSGVYTIVESNGYMTTEYSAVYVSPGDIQTEITIERAFNNNYITQTLSKQDDGVRLRANYFKITDIFNAVDEYGLIKIYKNGEEFLICQIDDLEAIPEINEEGNYEILLVDRLGNELCFFVDIYTAKKIYTFTLIDGSNIILSEKAFGGREFELPTLESDNEKLEFVGWQDENGKIYNGTYAFNSPSDVVLNALYHYKNVEIEIYDGKKLNEISSNVGKTVVLPKATKDGYRLYGYRYILEDGTILFYREQITSVPNKESIRLDAVWVKNENPDNTYIKGQGSYVEISYVDGDVYYQITTEKCGKVSVPSLKDENLEFVGWIYEYKLKGMIFTDELVYNDVLKIGMSDENTIVLNGAWISKPETTVSTENSNEINEEKTKPTALPLSGSAPQGGFFGGTTEGAGSTLDGFIGGNGFALGVSLCALAFMLLLVSLRSKIKGCVSVILQKIKNSRGIGAFDASYSEEFNEGYEMGLSGRRKLAKVLISVMCIILCVITLVGPQTALLSYAADNINEAVFERQVQKEEEKAIEENVKLINSTLEKVEEIYEDDNLTEAQEFLYSVIAVELYYLGYTEIFPAYVLIGENTLDPRDDRIVNGIGYTSYLNAYEDRGKTYFDAGFLSFQKDGVITAEEVETGLKVRVSEEEADNYEYTDFLLKINRTILPSHYVAYGQYTFYQAADYVIQEITKEDDGTYFDAYGDVFSYDINDYCHFVNYDTEYNLDLYSIDDSVDYDSTLQSYMDAMSLQYSNGIDVTIEKADYISWEALNDYIAGKQNEKILGLDAETVLYYEANIPDSYYYVICKDGSVRALELPPDPLGTATIWERIAAAAIAVGAVVAGVALTVCFPGNPLAGAAAGALMGGALDLFFQVTVNGTKFEDVDWTSILVNVAVGAVTGAVAAGMGGGGAAAEAGKKAAQKAGEEVAKKTAKEVAKQIGKAALTGLVSGAVGGTLSYFGHAITKDMKITVGEAFKAIGTSMLIGTFAGAVAGSFGVVANVENASTAAFLLCQAASGAIIGFGSYITAMLINGQEFSWKDMLLSIGVSVAISVAFAIGSKLYYNKQTAKLQRQKSLTELSADDFKEEQLKLLAEAKNKSVQELKNMSPDDFDEYLHSIRASGIESAKKLEIDFLKKQMQYYEKYGTLPPDADGNIPTNWGTAQNITQDDALYAIENNKFPYEKGKIQYDAHHIKSVEYCIEDGDYMGIIDPDNLIIGERNSQHFKWHNENWQTRTSCVRLENGKVITSIDRKAMINHLDGLLG